MPLLRLQKETKTAIKGASVPIKIAKGGVKGRGLLGLEGQALVATPLPRGPLFHGAEVRKDLDALAQSNLGLILGVEAFLMDVFIQATIGYGATSAPIDHHQRADRGGRPSS